MNFIDYNINTLLFALMMSFRMGAFFKSMPIFSEIKVTGLVTILLPLMFAFLLAPSVANNILPVMTLDAIHIGYAIVTEIMVGVFMGFSLNVVMLLATMVGELMGMQAGLSMASLFDPNLGQVSVISYLIRNLFFLAFFAFNMHHAFIFMLVQSYQFIPVGGDFYSLTKAVPALMHLFASIYLMAFRIVLPVIVIILLSHLTMGIISITAPQMNIYFNAAISMNIVIAMLLFAISFPILFQFYNVGLDSLQNFIVGVVYAT